MGEDFSYPVNHLRPTLLNLSLTNLDLPDGFNQPINNLPNNLTQLGFGLLFNSPINYLPEILDCLYLNDSFNKIININILSKYLCEIHLPDDHQYLIDGVKVN